MEMQTSSWEIPVSLRRWFVAHFVVDAPFALPLLVAPDFVLRTLGWPAVDTVTARLWAAAALAIAVQSLVGRNEGPDVYRAMLNLKLVWSGAAIVGLIASVGSGAPEAAWAFLAIFIAFFGVWFHYRVRMKQMARATSLDSDGL